MKTKLYYLSKYQVLAILDSLQLIIKHSNYTKNKDVLALSTNEYKALMKIRNLNLKKNKNI